MISVDRLLNLTHQDIQDLEASNIGSHCNNPFVKLPTSSKEFDRELKDEYDEEEYGDDDLTPDMLSDGDDEPFIEVDYDNLLD